MKPALASRGEAKVGRSRRAGKGRRSRCCGNGGANWPTYPRKFVDYSLHRGPTEGHRPRPASFLERHHKRRNSINPGVFGRSESAAEVVSESKNNVGGGGHRPGPRRPSSRRRRPPVWRGTTDKNFFRDKRTPGSSHGDNPGFRSVYARIRGVGRRNPRIGRLLCGQPAARSRAYRQSVPRKLARIRQSGLLPMRKAVTPWDSGEDRRL